MEPTLNFNPERVIRRKEIIAPSGKITAILYENEIGRYAVVFLKDMEIIKEADITSEILDSDSVRVVDALIYELASEITKSKPW